MFNNITEAEISGNYSFDDYNIEPIYKKSSPKIYTEPQQQKKIDAQDDIFFVINRDTVIKILLFLTFIIFVFQIHINNKISTRFRM
jgi:hypothetical protein